MDKCEDKGIVREADESLYLGQWREGTFSTKKQGKGACLYKKEDGNYDLYEGYWRDSQKEGKGRMIYAHGAIYVGEWKEGQAHGRGVYLYAESSERLKY